jgi:mono/diheme cytochrome c family protein
MESHKKMRNDNYIERVIRVFCLFAFSILISMCSSRKSLPLKGPLDIKEAKVMNGQKVYAQQCYKCHPTGEAGLGPALNSNPAPGFLKRFQIRHGLGVMPSFKRDEISKENMDDLMAYLKALKHNK